MPQFITISGTDHPIYPGVIHKHWRETAEAKGFDLIGRVDDRYHLALCCQTCGKISSKHLFSVMSHNPHCPHCIESAWRATAKQAGLTYLRRVSGDRHYAIYRAPCGHELRRQFEFVERIARGEVQHRCELCLEVREQDEAEARGWELVGRDPKGNPNYRLYRHADGCGAEARIARVNMQTGRFTCPGCGESWATARSFLYLMRFGLGSGATVVKFGFSRDPLSRMNFQLPRQPDLPRTLLRIVPMRSGQEALQVEKRLHGKLQARHPAALVPPEAFAADLTVKSEIYAAHMERPILNELRRIARGQIPKSRQGGRPSRRRNLRSDQPRPDRRTRSCS